MDTISGDQEIHKTSLDGVLTLFKPDRPAPVVFDSPHSGRHIPDDFDYACADEDLIRSEDRFVDELFADAPQKDAVLLQAEFPRTYIDLNRYVDDIDPEVYAGIWPITEQGYVTPNPTDRSYAGIGLIRRLIRPGVPVYNRKLRPAEIQERINNYYTPYYDALGQTIDDLHYQFGQVWHINCHSMPSYSVRKVRTDRADPSKPIDFVLGNRDGTTCDPDFTQALRNLLVNIGYNVAINAPYKGVALVDHFSAPLQGRHSLQIEINKGLYLDEKTGEKSKNFDRLKADINILIDFIVDYSISAQHPMAAD